MPDLAELGLVGDFLSSICITQDEDGNISVNSGRCDACRLTMAHAVPVDPGHCLAGPAEYRTISYSLPRATAPVSLYLPAPNQRGPPELI